MNDSISTWRASFGVIVRDNINMLQAFKRLGEATKAHQAGIFGDLVVQVYISCQGAPSGSSMMGVCGSALQKRVFTSCLM